MAQPRAFTSPVGFRTVLLVGIVGVAVACATTPQPSPVVGKAQASASVPAAAPSAPQASPPADKPKRDDASHVEAALLQLSGWVKGHRGELGVTVADATTGEILMNRDGNVPRNPASVSKLLTAWVALETLGVAHRFTTAIRGTITRGRAARLLLRSDGNPTLGLDELRGMVAELREQGLASVDDLFVDQSAFGDDFVPPAFDQQPDEWAAFRAPVCATALERNRLAVQVRPTENGRAARVSVSPPGIAEVTGTVRTVKRGKAKSGVGVTVQAKGDTLTVQVGGAIEERQPPTVIYRRVQDPRKLIGSVLGELLREARIEVPRRVQLWTTSETPPPVLVSRSSAPLPVILRSLGKDSDNFTAEMLLRAIGAKAKGIGSSEVGAEVALAHLGRLGVVEPGTQFINGSGLFDANRLSTDALVRVLAEVNRNARYLPEFLAQLSLGDKDGTLKNRFAKLPVDCVIRAKTGTLKATNGLAGVVERSGKKPLAFALIVEGITEHAELRTAIDDFVSSLCASPR